MSAASDKFEQDVAKTVNDIVGLKASRPTVSTKYSDVLIESGKIRTWLEVKMGHKDNLGNPRCSFDGKKWSTSSIGPLAEYIVQTLNKSQDVKKFIDRISAFSGIPVSQIKIPTTKGGLKEPGAVPLFVMKEYFSQPGVNRYILNIPNVDLGKLVTAHYLEGKAEPAHYMQAADDFYLIGKDNPLGLPSRIPLLSGRGSFKMRISTRSQFYEVQPEVKIDHMPNSPYSVKPRTSKKNPFLNA